MNRRSTNGVVTCARNRDGVVPVGDGMGMLERRRIRWPMVGSSCGMVPPGRSPFDTLRIIRPEWMAGRGQEGSASVCSVVCGRGAGGPFCAVVNARAPRNAGTAGPRSGRGSIGKA